MVNNSSIISNFGNRRFVTTPNAIRQSISQPIFNLPPQQMRVYPAPPQQTINRPSSLPTLSNPVVLPAPSVQPLQYTNRSLPKPKLEIVSPRSVNNRHEGQNASANSSAKIENKVPLAVQNKPPTLLKSPITKQKFSFSNSNLIERTNQPKKIENSSLQEVKAADLKSESETVSNNDKR